MSINKTVTLNIKGMSCNHCVNFVQNTIDELKGIASKEVNLEEAKAVVEFDSTVISEQEIAAAINDTHFEVINFN